MSKKNIISSVRKSVRYTIKDPIWDFVYDSVYASVWDSVWIYIRDSVYPVRGNVFIYIDASTDEEM